MKNILLFALLAGAITAEAAPASTTQTGQQAPVSKKEMKQKRKLSKQNGPEIYKGTVAEQSRIVNDAPGSEKDKDADEVIRKNGKTKPSKKQ